MTGVRPCLAVIPARGGSKGLPGKNIRPFAGLPLIAHSIECARLSGSIDRLVVSTDAEDIAAVARECGADVPFLRPGELAADDTPMIPVLQHALAEVERLDEKRYASLLLLDPTSPGRIPDDIDLAFRLLAGDTAATCVVAVSRPTFNPLWVGVVMQGSYLVPAFGGQTQFQRRQDVPNFLRINGSLYLWRTSFLRTAPNFWENSFPLPLEIPEARAFSIDDQYEFDLAQLAVQHRLIQLPWLEAAQ